MHSRISDQTDSNQTFPTQPRKVKRWLKHLPLANIGETTRQFYNGLKTLNRHCINAKHRLDILEAMRPTAGLILSNLNKHLISRSLPLPQKSYSIVQLQQSLLSELARGYKIIVDEIAEAELRLDRKSTVLITHRAMRYLGMRLLASYQIYAPSPQGVWLEINRLYLFAEKRALLDRAIRDAEYREIRKSNILDVYIQINLLALTRPTSLRQGEVSRVAVFLEESCRHCAVDDSPLGGAAGNVHYVNTNLDLPPQYAIKADIAISSSNRYFNLIKLINRLNDSVRNNTPGQAKAINIHSALSVDLSKRILSALTSNPKRRSARIEKNTQVNAAIGLGDIHKAIKDDIEKLWSEEQILASPSEFMLMLMPKEESDEYSISPELNMTGSAYAWDMVARGNVVTDKLLDNPKKTAVPDDSIEPAQTYHQSWEILDSSAGGYHLFWNGTQSSRAQVGELMALRETRDNQHHWRLGMIRWMQYDADKGLDVGIRMLSPKVLIATVEPKPQPKNRQQQIKPDRALALILPPVAIINQPQSLVTPSGRFKQGDELVIKLLNGKSTVKLTEMSEHSGAFSQFQYRELAEGSIENKPHKFDKLWSSL